MIIGNSLNKGIEIKIKSLVSLWESQIGSVIGNETDMYIGTGSGAGTPSYKFTMSNMVVLDRYNSSHVN